MIGALKKQGWERNTTINIQMYHNTILVPFSNPAYPACDLLLMIQVMHVDGKSWADVLWWSLVGPNIRKRDYAEWCGDNISLEVINQTAEKMQKRSIDKQNSLQRMWDSLQ